MRPDATSNTTRAAELRACADLAETTACLARLAGSGAGATCCGVFLLDYTGTRLVPHAVWDAAGGTAAPPDACLAVDERDPLCFALQTGQDYAARIDARSAAFPSLALLRPAGAVGGLAVLPLPAWKNILLGGVLLGFAGAAPPLEPLFPLRDVAALLLDAHIRRGREHRLLDSLHEDLARLEHSDRPLRTVETFFLGKSPAALRVRDYIAKAAPTDIAVLITGETGTGKELAASALHAAGPRHAAPFVTINCAALPRHLLESELFGHRKGAFSGAESDAPGLLRSAHGGTVLLDEIGEMPLELQAKLLRVLQDRQVRPVGDTRAVPVDIRIISSTNRDMEQAMASGAFRPDLYHRLAALHIHIPPLRDRREDIPLLARHFLAQMRDTLRRPGLTLTPESLHLLCAAPYPGNVRQLCNRIQKAAVLADATTDRLTPEAFEEPDGSSSPTDGERPMNLAANLRRLEKTLIGQAMTSCSGNISEAARMLDLPRSTLVSKLKKLAAPAPEDHGLRRPRGRQPHSGAPYGHHV